MREEFDDNPENPNPYEEPRVRKSIVIYPAFQSLTRHTDVTLSKLKKALATEEVAQFSEGQIPPHDITPSGFLRMAVDIEERQ